VENGGTGVSALDALTAAMGCARIEAGSYVGTGKHNKTTNPITGEVTDNSNVLNFDFNPKIIVFASSYTRSTGVEAFNSRVNSIVFRDSYLVHLDDDTEEWSLFTWGNNTVSWYSPDSASAQLNLSSKTYHYIAIG
jgi:hypothetical protein